MWTLLAFVVIGMVAGWAASLLVRHDMHPSDWGTLFIVGVASSLIAGTVTNLVLGDAFRLQVGGVVSSILVACVILWFMTRVRNQKRARAQVNRDGTHREPKGGKRHH